MSLDIKILYFLNNLAGKNLFFDDLIIFFASYLQYFLIFAFILFLYFSTYQNKEKFNIFLTTVISVIISRVVITEIIRFFYHRPRPFLEYRLNTLLLSDKWSFPSGHSAFFFAMAVAIYFYNKKLGIGFFIATVLMNISRVISGVHYPSDILGGAIIGITIAYSIFYFIERQKNHN